MNIFYIKDNKIKYFYTLDNKRHSVLVIITSLILHQTQLDP